MSYHIAPDPHPGRCPNLRPGGPPGFKYDRCLDRAGHDSACRFKEPAKLDVELSTTTFHTPPKPQPWTPPWEGDA